MYAGGGEFTENIDKMGGEGTAEFTHRAIQIYCFDSKGIEFDLEDGSWKETK